MQGGHPELWKEDTTGFTKTGFMSMDPITVDRDALLSAVATASRVVDPKSTMPILSHLFLVAQGGALCISGTDLNRTVVAVVPATVAPEAHEGRATALPLLGVQARALGR